METLRKLIENGIEELRILQTILMLVTTTEIVQGKALAKVRGQLIDMCRVDSAK